MSISGVKEGSDFTVGFLKEQLKYMTDKQRRTVSELEEKDALIQKIEHEKREMQRQCESMEIENIKMAEKLKELMNMQMSNNSNAGGGSQGMFCTPKVGKLQNKRVLEEDGIRCFDLDKQSVIMQDLNADEFDLRESIGLSCKSKVSKKSNSTIMKIQPPAPN
jgi:hypothetical protein